MIIPVILEKTWEGIVEKINLVENFSELIQIDIADDRLVEGKTFLEAFKLSEFKIKPNLELHLMVENPFDYLEEKITNVIKVCSQIEAPVDNRKFISRAHELGYKVGLSVNPDTNYAQLEEYLEDLDFVQFMDIVPGKQNQSLIPQVLSKIHTFRRKHPNVRIQVDGGVKVSNIKNLQDAGVDDFVVGSEITKSSNPEQKYVQLVQMTQKNRTIQKVAILGGAAWEKDEQPYQDAYNVSKVLAEAGYEIINGGGPGVMRASTEGAHAGGGRVVAITYHPNKPKRHYEGVDLKNKFDDEIITLDYFDRTKVMLQTTQFHIIFKGSLGTLGELGMSWISSWIHEPNNKPIVLYGEFWIDYLEVIDKHAKITDAEKSIVKVCTAPQEVLAYIKSFED